MKKLMRILLVMMACLLYIKLPVHNAFAKASTTSNVTISLSSSSKARYLTGRHNVSVAYDSKRRAIGLSTNGKDDPYATLEVSKLARVSADIYKYVVINYVAPSGSESAGCTQLFWKLGDGAYDGSRSTRFDAVRGGAVRSQVVDMSREPYWTGRISSIRIDPFESGTHAGNGFYISSVVFCATQKKAQSACRGTASSRIITQTDKDVLATNESSSLGITFDRAEVMTHFSSAHDVQVAYDSSAHAIRLTTTGGSDPHVIFCVSAAMQRYSIPADTYRYAVLRYRVAPSNVNASDFGQLFWRINDAGFSEGRSSFFPVTRSDNECACVMDLTALEGGAGAVTDVRIDPFGVSSLAGESMYLSSLTFFKDATVAALASGTLTCTMQSGTRFAASGHASWNATQGFVFSQGMSVVFDTSRMTQPFNRMSFSYSASAPLRMVVAYGQGSDLTIDTFYLDAGTNLTFSALIESYLSGGRAMSIRQLCLTPLTGNVATFSLHNLITDTVAQYGGGVAYIANNRFKLGIDLGYGGAISYLGDKACPIAGVDNLVNRYDAGRLIQQSYYGAGAAEGYVGNVYNKTMWRYNPVQGGDMHNNKSRIIDVRVSSDSIYIKAQPQDWSQNGLITPSYMENTYTLEGSLVKVLNRFTDYSGLHHPLFAQELPAVYTIGYLDRFTYYAGSQSWCNDALTSFDNLPFWGDEMAKCTFMLQPGSTERWCAWTASDADYGIGLNADTFDHFVAGRFNTNRSKSDTDVSTSYVTAIKSHQHTSYEPFSYSYCLTAGSLSEIRSTFAPKSGAAASGGVGSAVSPVSADLTQPGAENYFTLTNDFIRSFDVGQGAVCLMASTGFDPYVHLDLKGLNTNLLSEDYGELRFTYMIPASSSKQHYIAEIFPCTGAQLYAVAGHSVRMALVADGTYHVISVSLRDLPYWAGSINKIRFDLFDSAAGGDVIYLKDITLAP